MGKTYRTQTDFDHFDDLFDSDYEEYPDFDEDMNFFLERQASGPVKRGKRNRNSPPPRFTELEQYRLPRDWQDFDYGSESRLQDD